MKSGNHWLSLQSHPLQIKHTLLVVTIYTDIMKNYDSSTFHFQQSVCRYLNDFCHWREIRLTEHQIFYNV